MILFYKNFIDMEGLIVEHPEFQFKGFRSRISQLWRNLFLSKFYCDNPGVREAFNALGDVDSYTDSKARRYFAQIDYNCSVFG